MHILCIIPLLSRRCKYANDTLIANTSCITSLFVRLALTQLQMEDHHTDDDCLQFSDGSWIT